MTKLVRAIFFVLFFVQASAWATQIPGSITLMNDSPFILTATVYTHSGDYLGQVTLQPGEQKNFTSNLSSTSLNRPGHSEVSITPYRIIWTCAGGGFYSMCRDGSVGATVRANECPGQLFCTPKEEQKKLQVLPPGKPNQK
ncbi:MAG: hypothetical protein HW387_1687 [Parachlamydiales bacterium]|nr:hypothetical protein [Parachlamydiales bacterium]